MPTVTSSSPSPRYRARVEKVESLAKVHVFYIDYGNVSWEGLGGAQGIPPPPGILGRKRLQQPQAPEAAAQDRGGSGAGETGGGELMGQKQTEQIMWEAAEASVARVSTPHRFPTPPR